MIDAGAVALLAGTFGFAVLSALIPVLNVEAYVVAVVAAAGTALGTAAVGAATLGQLVGKVILFLSVRRGTRSAWLRRWRERHTAPDPLLEPHAEDAPVTRWQRVKRWTARWATVGIGQLDRPLPAAGLVLVSAGVGIPPLAVVTVAAGARKTPLWVFAVCTFVGRLARFAAIAAPVIWLVD